MNKTLKVLLLFVCLSSLFKAQNSTEPVGNNTKPVGNNTKPVGNNTQPQGTGKGKGKPQDLVNSQDSNVCSKKVNYFLKSKSNPQGPEPLEKAQVVTGLKFCTWLEGQASCCSAETINKLIESTNEKLANITADQKQADNSTINFINFISQADLQQQDLNKQMTNLSTQVLTLRRQLTVQLKREALRFLQNTTNGTQPKPQGQQNGTQPQSQGQQRPNNSTQQQNNNGSKSSQGGVKKNSTGKPPKDNQFQSIGNASTQFSSSNGVQVGLDISQIFNYTSAANISVQSIKKLIDFTTVDQFKEKLKLWQSERVKCLKYLASLKTKFICMGCDYANMSSLVNNTQLSLPVSLQSDINNNCYEYAKLNEKISILQDKSNTDLFEDLVKSLKQQRKNVQKLNSQVQNVSTLLQSGEVNQDKADDLSRKVNETVKDFEKQQSKEKCKDTNITLRKLPKECVSASSCQFLVNHLLSYNEGGVSERNASNPGLIFTLDTGLQNADGSPVEATLVSFKKNKEKQDKKSNDDRNNNQQQKGDNSTQAPQQEGTNSTKQQDGSQQSGNQKQNNDDKNGNNGNSCRGVKPSWSQNDKKKGQRMIQTTENQEDFSGDIKYVSSGYNFDVQGVSSGMESSVEKSLVADPNNVQSTQIQTSVDDSDSASVALAGQSTGSSSSNSHILTILVVLILGLIL